MINYDAYETVIGLEVHAQLLTQSKLFCGDSTAFGAAPNTHVSPITLGYPGTLPKMNKKAIEFAIRMGLACHCEIEKENYFARKNYFYPDLPKGYQVSQHTTPICKGGFVKIKVKEEEKNIRLNRIHLEEDAGKSLHDVDLVNTSIDYNRAGTPLIEIVTEPDLRSGDEAFAYLTEIRMLVRYLEVCDGNMEEGSLRCDANISVRKKGDTKLGTKVEVKNLNSIRNVKKAIETESKKLIETLENGGTILQQTLSYNADNGTSFPLRDKEEADDYRYFAEPDLTPFHLQDDFIELIRQNLPALQEQRISQYVNQYKLSVYDATVITEEKKLSDYFESILQLTQDYKAVANWIIGPVKSWMNDTGKEIEQFPIPPERLGSLINLVKEGKLSFSIASSKIFPVMLSDTITEPLQIAMQLNVLQESDTAAIEEIVNTVLAKFPDKVKEYKKGKKGLIGLFVGEVMKVSKGKADPKITNDIVAKKLSE
ncbi:MAG: Asp-tRNA(Asn)/Glu-tRNA(Gln) amidotransferase subunit GatB [Bacteroidetes bacterium]|nr:Asp-tRNA(Asn)/Glu-tRNA(Gln) amidotransferase subunit GatB [Bacteroidota bacterium]